jgi:hypothetical protein
MPQGQGQGQQPFSVNWVIASVVIFTAMELLIALVIAPAILVGKLASPMLQMRLQMLMHLGSFLLGGVAVGIVSPGVRLTEPAVGAFIAVMLTFMMSFFIPHHWMSFDLSRLMVGGGIAFVLAMAGAYSAEKWMGNVEAEGHAGRRQVRERMWGEHGLLGTGDSFSLRVPDSSSSSTSVKGRKF